MLVLLRSKKGIPLWQGDGEFSTSRQLGNHYRYQSLPCSITQKSGSFVRNLKQGTPISLWVLFTWIGTSRHCYNDGNAQKFGVIRKSAGWGLPQTLEVNWYLHPLVLLKQNPQTNWRINRVTLMIIAMETGNSEIKTLTSVRAPSLHSQENAFGTACSA